MPVSRPGPWFAQALDSVLGQDWADLEVVVADNTGGLLEPVVRSRADARIRCLTVAEPNFTANHCRAIDAAAGDLVAFLHDDDVWHPAYLSSVLEVLDGDPDVGLVLVDMEEIDPGGRPLRRRPSELEDGLQSDPLRGFLRRDAMALIPSASVFRRAALDANARPWPDVIAADLTMYLDCVLAGWRVHHLSRPLVRYRIHAQQSSTRAVEVVSAVLTVLEGYRFPEAAHERLRARRIGASLVDRAAARLRAGDRRAARADVRSARGLAGPAHAARAVVVGVFSHLPPVLFRGLEAAVRAAVDRAVRRGRRPGPAAVYRADPLWSDVP